MTPSINPVPLTLHALNQLCFPHAPCKITQDTTYPQNSDTTYARKNTRYGKTDGAPLFFPRGKGFFPSKPKRVCNTCVEKKKQKKTHVPQAKSERYRLDYNQNNQKKNIMKF